ncbi:hypothetical protein [Nonomuraea basaltis]|uniref:hypothetical protein n=1 Tax=Nonomuraea basaltis TaxID=2495887 RepID=UPI00110C51AD|nr:hypothetical protein [Nonomuraea basaltis]TMR95588.1 hypothetical protein EJK15_27925 [Nonomuraea basaltis]
MKTQEIPEIHTTLRHLTASRPGTLLGGATRGDYTVPAHLLDLYTEIQELAGTPAGPGTGLSYNDRNRKAVELADEIGRGFAYNNAQLLADHIQPALDKLTDQAKPVVKLLGRYAHEPNPTVDLLVEADDVRHAYIQLGDIAIQYGNIRAGWRILRQPDGQDTIDPHGLLSPLAEFKDLPDAYPDWWNAANQRGTWPWIGGDRGKLAWAIANDVTLWAPSAQQQTHEWETHRGTTHKLNPYIIGDKSHTNV